MRLKLITTLVASSVLVAGCGGGSSSSTSTSPDPSNPGTTQLAQATVFTGTAATGAAFVGADVSIIDKTGTVVGTGKTGADGSYTITLSANAQAPFVLQAVRDDQTLVSVAASTTDTNINISPITTLIAARLSASGDPTKLAVEMQANPSLVSSTLVKNKLDEVIAVLKPLFDATSTSINPLTGTFKADGTGLDQALDSVSITITPDSTNTSNIEIAVKRKSADDSPETAILKFSSNATTVPSLPVIAPSTLVESGTTTLIAELLQRMASCYALSATQRVTTPDVTSANASTVVSDVCKGLFEGNDPSVYLNSGSHVGSSDAFSGLWKSSVTNVTFDRGNYEFSRSNGDLVISYRVVNTNETQYAVVRKSSDGKLRFYGNQYQYPGDVSPYHQIRSYLTQPSANNYSTGYTLFVPNNGQFSKVLVTTPKGGVFTLVPSAGVSFLVLQKGNTTTSTDYLRIRSEFADTTRSDNPATYETSLVYATTQASNEEIASYPESSLWRFDYFLTNNASSTPDATQYYRTVNRALSIPEMKIRPLASLVNEDATYITSNLTNPNQPNAALVLNNVDNVQFDWSVPNGGLSPYLMRIFGRSPTGVRFEDSTVVTLNARTGVIMCAPVSSADDHCTTSVNNAKVYANSTKVNGFDLVARDERKRGFSHFNATYTILP